MEISKKEYWSGLLFPPPGDLFDPGIDPRSPALQGDSSPSESSGKPLHSFLAFCYSYNFFAFCCSRRRCFSRFKHSAKGPRSQPVSSLPPGGGATHLTLKNKVCRQKAVSLKAPHPDSGGKSWPYGGQESRSLEFGGSSIFSQAPEAPRLWLGPGWNPEQIQKCLRETGTEVGGEDPASDSPARGEATSNRPPLGLKPDSIGQVTPFPLWSYTEKRPNHWSGQLNRLPGTSLVSAARALWPG